MNDSIPSCILWYGAVICARTRSASSGLARRQGRPSQITHLLSRIFRTMGAANLLESASKSPCSPLLQNRTCAFRLIRLLSCLALVMGTLGVVAMAMEELLILIPA
jgi:hypothetical protein